MEEDKSQQSTGLEGVAEEVPNEPSEGSEKPSEVSEQHSEIAEERFGHQTKSREKTEDHTLPVREVAKILEEKGLDVTERTLLNWCHPNKRDGSYRLDCYFDSVEKKYYVTPQSVQAVIPYQDVSAVSQEEIPTQQQSSETAEPIAEGSAKVSEDIPKENSERSEGIEDFPKTARDHIRELEQKNYLLEVQSAAKDTVIKKYEDTQDKVYDFVAEQGKMIGRLEQQVMQLEGPKNQEPRQSPKATEAIVEEPNRSPESSENNGE